MISGDNLLVLPGGSGGGGNKDDAFLKSDLKRTKNLQKKKMNILLDDNDYDDSTDFGVPACKRLCYDDEDDDDDSDGFNLRESTTTCEINNKESNTSIITNVTTTNNSSSNEDSGDDDDSDDNILTGKQGHKRVMFSALKNTFASKAIKLPSKTPHNDTVFASKFNKTGWFSEPTARVSEPVKATVYVRREPLPKPAQSGITVKPPKIPVPPELETTTAAAPPPPKRSLLPLPDAAGFGSDDEDIPRSSRTSATPQLIRASYTPTTPLKCPNTPVRTPSISRCQIPPLTVAHPAMFRKVYGGNNNVSKTQFSLDNLEFCSEIGRGSFGSVHKVRCIKDNQYYALKISNKPFSSISRPSLPLSFPVPPKPATANFTFDHIPKPPLTENPSIFAKSSIFSNNSNSNSSGNSSTIEHILASIQQHRKKGSKNKVVIPALPSRHAKGSGSEDGDTLADSPLIRTESIEKMRALEGGASVYINNEVERMVSIPYHPNILSIVQAWLESDRKIYILTDLCEKSLKRRLEELWAEGKGLSEEQILAYAHDIFSGVHHLHKHRTMHLDLKPDNLLLCNGGTRVKVGDFGLAHRDGDKVIPSEGDNKYMAPELLEGVFGYPADIFSLGITLYEMAIPNIVLQGNGERWRALRNNDIDFSVWSHSEDLKELIKWMLRAAPEERPTAEQLVSHKIFGKKKTAVPGKGGKAGVVIDNKPLP